MSTKTTTKSKSTKAAARKPTKPHAHKPSPASMLYIIQWNAGGVSSPLQAAAPALVMAYLDCLIEAFFDKRDKQNITVATTDEMVDAVYDYFVESKYDLAEAATQMTFALTFLTALNYLRFYIEAPVKGKAPLKLLEARGLLGKFDTKFVAATHKIKAAKGEAGDTLVTFPLPKMDVEAFQDSLRNEAQGINTAAAKLLSYKVKTRFGVEGLAGGYRLIGEYLAGQASQKKPHQKKRAAPAAAKRKMARRR